MKIIMTILVRNEQDIIASNIDFHYSQGIDFIIVTDNLSTDKTQKILKKYEQKGKLTIINETSDDYSQHKWVTRMARIAKTDYQADWVINNDADEFWLPDDKNKTLRQILSQVPKDITACKVKRVNFIPPLKSQENTFFAKSMTIREIESFNTIGQPLAPKVCHRAHDMIEIKQGNHHVRINGEKISPIDIPVTILHFPLRSYQQFKNKIAKGGAAYSRNTELHKDIGSTWRKLYQLHLNDTLEEYYNTQVPNKTERLKRLSDNTLMIDKRLLNHLTRESKPKKFMRNFFNLFTKTTKKHLKNTENKHEGVITLADANYFPGLIMLYNSIQLTYPVPIICYDIGLTNKQKEWCQTNLKNLKINDIPKYKIIETIKNHTPEKTLAKKGKREWPLWICPFLIKNSPYEKTLWLDCDVIILRNLEELFRKIDKGPVFTPENLAPHVTANKKELYQLLPIKREFNEEKALINAGVSGWHKIRDKKILDDYSNTVAKAFENHEIMKAISWHDQGALIWAILNNGVENHIETGREWNLCVKHTNAKDLKFTWDKNIYKKLQASIPDTNILHWNGQKVPWI